MGQDQSDNLWQVTSGIRADVLDIKVCLARLEERAKARDGHVETQGARMDRLETKIQRLDMKVAAAMGGVALISHGLQLLVAA